MRVCIPTFLTTSQKAGIAFYTINLIQALQEIDSENEYFLLTYIGNDSMFEINKPNFRKVLVPFKERSRLHLRLFVFYYHTFRLRSFIKKNNIDLIHIPSTWFVNSSYPTLITIHDVVEFKIIRYSKVFSRIKQLMVKTALKNARKIFTVSKSSKEDICSLGGKSEKVVVTYNGVNKNEINITSDEVRNKLNKYKLSPRKYFIFVGTAQFHKNIPRLIYAFDKLNNDFPEFKLVLAGKKDNACNEIEDAILSSGKSGQILQLDYIDDVTKQVLIKESAAFVFISLHEGFGMPILEANLLEAPLIVSNSSSLPEIAGNTALYVDPLNIDDIYNKMKLIIEDDQLKKNLIASAKSNLERFNWRETAKITKDTYLKYSKCN